VEVIPMTTRPNVTPLATEPRKSLEELIAEQGVVQTATYERLLGSAAELWQDDAEFQAFLDHVQAIRHEQD
jgi:hypothetical protein